MANELTILAVGDICIVGGGKYPGVAHIVKKGGKPGEFLEKVAPILRQGDFTTGNLEGPICDALPPIEGKAGTGGEIIRMSPDVADALKEAGFHALAVANNHSMDYGAEGMLQTMANLKRVGMVGFGGGRNIEEARKPAILERGGVKVASLSYTSVFVPGTFPAGENKVGAATVAVNTSYQVPGNVMYAPGAPPKIITTPKREDFEKMLDDVRKAKVQADVVAVHQHWGLTKYANSVGSGLPVEDSLFYVLNYQEDLGRACIDAGADLVYGHHPHRLQGIEVYKGKFIFYSLSNLVMSFHEGPNLGEESVIAKGYIDRKTKKLTRVTLLPMMVPTETTVPYMVPIAKAGGIISELQRLSKKYKTTFRVEGEEIAIDAGK